jgi:curved DNA-binding protein CbpA
MLMYIANVQKGAHGGVLPGEQQPQLQQQQPQLQQQQPQLQMQQQQQQQQQQQLVTKQAPRKSAYDRLVKPKGQEKAISYFQGCLEVLGLEEEVAMTEESLKLAYKKAAVKAHPDKRGGSEEKFEIVTRAYAYLSEILTRVNGGRKKESKVEAPAALQETRTNESQAWKQAEPVRLNPQKLDMNAFNTMYEQTRIPDPDDDGYGDWLKNEVDAPKGPAFSGKFNRDVFNKMFESAQQQQQQNQLMKVPQAMTLAPMSGVELGRTAADTYTAPANANLKYTDLKQAYTTENVLTNQVSNVRIDLRDIKEYRATRERAPDPLNNEELANLAKAEEEAAKREKNRQLRAAQDDSVAEQYFQRMKRLVITSDPGK